MDLKIVLRQILTDRLTLKAYQSGQLCSWSDIKRRLLLDEKEQDFNIPDHFYRSASRLHIDQNEIDSIKKMIEIGFSVLSDYYLEWDSGKCLVFVNESMLPEWQNTLTFIPPLILVSSKIVQQQPLLFSSLSDISSKRIENYLDKFVVQNALYTALPTPKINKLDELIQKTGLNDLHIHLNKAMEFDNLWQDCLNYPTDYYKYFKDASGNFLVVEQIEYEDFYKDANELHCLLLTARAIRYELVHQFLFCQCNKKPKKWDNKKVDEINDLVVREVHPLSCYLKKNADKYTNLSLECLMHILILSRLSDKSSYKYKEALSCMYHHYLLIEGAINRFVVQQLHQKGFQQFQKTAENKLRERSEKKYASHFLQLNGNSKGKNLVNHIEGRFSPGKSSNQISKKVGMINAGLEEYMQALNIPLSTKSELFSLTFHFIKSWDKTETFCLKVVRHELARKDLWETTKAIIDYNNIPKNNLSFNIPVSGVDAASSEFNAPPEVFAPIYRFLRRNDTSLHFTFHVGEDFSHIVSGLRAIYEAVVFLDLLPHSRIGHGTALGVSPGQWLDKVGKCIYLPQGEWLDNLIFIYHLMSKCGKRSIKKRIEFSIKQLSMDMYGREYSVSDVEKAWLLRKYCPILFFCEDSIEAKSTEVFDSTEWDFILNEKKFISHDVMSLMKLYHFNREIYNKVIYFNNHLFAVHELEYFQSVLLKYLLAKDIAVEILPTSNTRISIYDNTKEHHVKKWLYDDRRGCRLFCKRHFPDVVIGTDDPGIFSTNIYNEYAHVYVSLKESGIFDVNSVIDKLHSNSFKYSFAPFKRD